MTPMLTHRSRGLSPPRNRARRPDWVDDEPGWAEARRQLASIYRRVRARWLRTVIFAVLATALAFAYQARKQPLFPASVVIRVVEANFDPNTAPPTSYQLTEYFSQVALSRQVLRSLIDEYDLYPEEQGIDPNLALEVMREDIELYVIRNYFAQQRYSEDPPRTARVVITYTGRDPDKALAVARHMGRVVAEDQTQSRRTAARAAADSMAATVAELRGRLERARAEEAELQLRVAEAPPGHASSELVRLRSVMHSIAQLRRELDQAESRRTGYELREQLEDSEMGLRFELVDPGRPAEVLLSRGQELTLTGLLAFLFLLPMVVVAVGSFDGRIYDADNLRRLGLEPFGHIPSFPGHRVGSLDSRRKALDTR